MRAINVSLNEFQAIAANYQRAIMHGAAGAPFPESQLQFEHLAHKARRVVTHVSPADSMETVVVSFRPLTNLEREALKCQ